MPETVKKMIHRRLPAVVQNIKGVRGINSIPAGTDINVRIPGINLPQKTKAIPYLENQL